MKVYQTNEIKNISILGSSGSGKTTLAEAMLYEGGVIKRRGSVEAGNTVSDYFPVEKEYGYSVFSTVFSVEWQDRKLNFIDCPGSDDFIGGAVSALNVTDTALMVLNAQYGVEVGTINQFRYTEQFHKPVIFVVNQLDNDKADYDGTIAQAIEIPSYVLVPRPNSSNRTRLREDMLLRISEASFISTMKVDSPTEMLSEAPTRVNILSTIPIRAHSAGTKQPICAISVIRAVWRSKADLPAMFGPVIMIICCFSSSR